MSQSFDKIKIKKNSISLFFVPSILDSCFLYILRQLGSAELSRKWMWNFFSVENALVVISIHFVTAKNHRARAIHIKPSSKWLAINERAMSGTSTYGIQFWYLQPRLMCWLRSFGKLSENEQKICWIAFTYFDIWRLCTAHCFPSHIADNNNDRLSIGYWHYVEAF